MDTKTRLRIEGLARRFRIKKSDLIRTAIYAALPKWESEGVRLIAEEHTK